MNTSITPEQARARRARFGGDYLPFDTQPGPRPAPQESVSAEESTWEECEIDYSDMDRLTLAAAHAPDITMSDEDKRMYDGLSEPVAMESGEAPLLYSNLSDDFKQRWEVLNVGRGTRAFEDAMQDVTEEQRKNAEWLMAHMKSC